MQFLNVTVANSFPSDYYSYTLREIPGVPYYVEIRDIFGAFITGGAAVKENIAECIFGARTGTGHE